MKNDYRLLVRELFAIARADLDHSIRKVQFPSEYLQPIYDTNVDLESLQMKHTFLSHILKTTADKFGLSTADLIRFLRIKKMANVDFHLDTDIREFAQLHMFDDKYDLSSFIKEEQLLIDLGETEWIKLQTVFERLCRIFNDPKYYDLNEQFLQSD